VWAVGRIFFAQQPALKTASSNVFGAFKVLGIRAGRPVRNKAMSNLIAGVVAEILNFDIEPGICLKPEVDYCEF
jgi:hypothetical protein